MDESSKQDMIKRLRVSRHAESDEVLQFWREHGIEWAREEASYQQIRRLAEISRAASQLEGDDAIQHVVGELKAIWKNGWPTSAEPYDWDEMNDMLPPSALLAFVQGVEAAWNEVQEKV